MTTLQLLVALVAFINLAGILRKGANVEAHLAVYGACSLFLIFTLQ